jgi:hypothetical protein
MIERVTEPAGTCPACGLQYDIPGVQLILLTQPVIYCGACQRVDDGRH